ncbi:hypothetical protein D3C76_1073110 [compost metagenome]
MRDRQNVRRDMRVVLEEVAHLRSDETGPEGFGTADAQVPGEPPGGAENLLAGYQQRTFQGFGVADQTLPLHGQDKTCGSRLLEQQSTQTLLQGADAPRHRGVVHPQAASCTAGGAGTGDLEEETHVVPVQWVLRCAFLHIHRAFLPIHMGNMHLYTRISPNLASVVFRPGKPPTPIINTEG